MSSETYSTGKTFDGAKINICNCLMIPRVLQPASYNGMFSGCTSDRITQRYFRGNTGRFIPSELAKAPFICKLYDEERLEQKTKLHLTLDAPYKSVCLLPDNHNTISGYGTLIDHKVVTSSHFALLLQ